MPTGHTLLLLVAMLTLSAELRATDARAAQRITEPPDRLTMLAESLGDADEAQRWAFADTLLGVLLDTYGEELHNASVDEIRSPKRRAKVQRWQRATRDLIARLTDARLRLSEGASAQIHVDRHRQLLLFVEQQAIAFTAPRPGAGRHMAQQALERYCAAYDCSILAGLDDTAATPQAVPAGYWSMQARRPPAYEIDGRLRCVFVDLQDRVTKQRACEAAAAELRLLEDALGDAGRRGFVIDWALIAGQERTAGAEIELKVTARGDYLRLPIPHLLRLDDSDWSALIDWLGSVPRPAESSATIRTGERLLAAAASGGR